MQFTPEELAQSAAEAHAYTEYFFARGARLRRLLATCRWTRRARLWEALGWWNDELQDTIG